VGIIQHQGSKSSFYIILGFGIGAINMLILFPMYFSPEDIGLTRAILDTSLAFSSLCTLGAIPIINKFNPFYKHYLNSKQNDLPLLTLLIILFGYGLLLSIGLFNKEFVLRKLGKSPKLADYFIYIYPATLLILIFTWLEAFSWSLKKSVISNFLKETVVRIITTLLIVLYGLNFLDFNLFIILFCLIYFIPVISLFIIMIKTREWSINFISISSVTKRLKGRMFSFTMYLFAGQFFNVLARTSDTFFVFGLRGLSETGIFTIAVYLATIIEIPQRSLISICTPILSESWKNKDLQNIKNIYYKSVSNLMLISCFLFGFIFININNLISFLQFISHSKNFSYEPIATLFLILGISKLFDLSTGVNGILIGTSNLWRFDFFTNLTFIIISLPLNYILIKNFGLNGLALSNLATIIIFNSIRYFFILHKFKFQPYNIKHLKFLLSSGTIILLINFMPNLDNFILDGTLKIFIYLISFYLIVSKINPAPELTNMFFDFLEKRNIKILKRF
jgi:O-antigen/teichoic acid export membrane protein